MKDIVEERNVIIISNNPAWSAVKENLKFLYKIEALLLVTEATSTYWYRLIQKREKNVAEVVYAVGGGLAVDAGKYIARELGLELVCIPTALSVDAFFTSSSGVREGGCVKYIETKAPNTVLIDYKLVANAPASIRAAGITDVISIATGSWDWKFAHEHGQNPPGMEFIPWVYENAQSILNGVLDCAEAAGRGDKDGLKTLYDCLAMEVQLCNQVGHARPEEGSEHYFAYSVENLTGHGLPHGDLVGPGIMIMSKLQGQATGALEAALKACHIPLDRIPEDIVQQTLKSLPAYARKHNLAYGIAHEMEKYL